MHPQQRSIQVSHYFFLFIAILQCGHVGSTHITTLIKTKPFCKSTMEKDTNFELAAHGYDLLQANPYDPKGNPGFKMGGNIFKLRCQDSKGSAGFWNFAHVRSYLNCEEELQMRTMRTYKDYLAQRSSASSFGFGTSFETEVSAFGFSVGASASHSQSTSQEESNIKHVFEEEQGEIVMAKTTCLTHDLAYNTRYYRPVFSRGFVNALYTLEKALGQPEPIKVEAYKEFVLTYGTHYLSRTKFGASMTYQRVFHSRSSSEEESNSRSDDFRTAASACLSAGGSYAGVSASGKICANTNSSSSSSSSNSSSTGDAMSSSDLRIISRGSRPTENTEAWASSEFSVVPILFELAPITDILLPQFVNISQTYGFPRDLDIDGVRQMVTDFNKNYCEIIFNLTKEECSTTLKGCGLNDNCPLGTTCQEDPDSEQGFSCQKLEDVQDFKMLTFGNGYTDNLPEDSSRIDLIDLTSMSSCPSQIPDYPVKANGQAAVVLPQRGIVVSCGGRWHGDLSLPYCFNLIDSMWLPGPSLFPSRFSAQAIALTESQWMMIGGHFSPDHTILSNVNYFNINGGYEALGELQQPLEGACFVKVNENVALAYGGKTNQNGAVTGDTYLFDIVNRSWNFDLPKLQMARSFGACGIVKDTMDDNVEYAIIAAGLIFNPVEFFDTTEVLHVINGEVQGGWNYGPPFPAKLAFSASAQAPDGRSFFVSGGSTSWDDNINNAKNDIFRFRCSGGYCSWGLMPQKLPSPRFNHVMVAVPADRYPCEPENQTK